MLFGMLLTNLGQSEQFLNAFQRVELCQGRCYDPCISYEHYLSIISYWRLCKTSIISSKINKCIRTLTLWNLKRYAHCCKIDDNQTGSTELPGSSYFFKERRHTQVLVIMMWKFPFKLKKKSKIWNWEFKFVNIRSLLILRNVLNF